MAKKNEVIDSPEDGLAQEPDKIKDATKAPDGMKSEAAVAAEEQWVDDKYDELDDPNRSFGKDKS